MGCQGLAVPTDVMHHVVRVESSYNPYAIGVVGGRLVRQPKNLPEALATVRMLEGRGLNFSIGLAQVNRYNLDKYGLDSYEQAFEPCANLAAGSKILADCYRRAKGNWGKSFSCYYSGNFSTGFRHGYVQKIYASVRQERGIESNGGAPFIEVVSRAGARTVAVARSPVHNSAPLDEQVEFIQQSGTQTKSVKLISSRIQPVPSRIMPANQAASFSAVESVPQKFISQRLVSEDRPPQETATESVAALPIKPADRIGRAVPTAGLSGASSMTATQSVLSQEGSVVKRRSSSIDKALIVSDVDEDRAFVF